jgi:PAS domain S-box-containing protein
MRGNRTTGKGGGREHERAERELLSVQEALRQSNERNVRILESITDGFVVLDASWRFSYVNGRAEEILRPLGKTRENLLGRDLWAEFPPLVGSEFERTFREVMVEQVSAELEALYPPLSSWFLVRVYPSREALSIYFQDVTRRKQAEAWLASERVVLELIATGAPLTDVLERLAREAESQSIDGMLCSVLLLDEAGEPFADSHGLRAHDSSPIFSSQGSLLGSMVTYYREARPACPRDEQIIALAVRLAAIAIERERSEQALRSREERLRASFEQAGVGIATAGTDGRFVQMNRKFSEILGRTRAELRQLSFRDVTHPDDLAETDAASARLGAGEDRDYSLEKRYLRRDGTVVWCLTSVTQLRESSEVDHRFVGVIEDISPRKRAEAALRRSDQFNRSIIDSSRDAIMTLALDGVLVWMSETGQGAFGIDDLAAVLGRSWLELWQEEDRDKARVAVEAAARGGTGSFVGQLPAPGESRFWDVVVTPVRDAAESPESLLAVARDVTGREKAAEERKMLLESERHARAAAERASQMKDEFLATLSHELRTPLSAILGWAYVLRAKSPGSEELNKGLETIERNARMQTQLIEDLLDMSRITSGKVRLDVQPVHAASLVESALEAVRPAAEAKGIRLERTLDPRAGSVSGDPSRLQQVVWNLLTNAIKFTPRGGRVHVVLERINSHVEISVADTGVGIDPEFIAHVFDRFRQADGSTTRRFGGLGLGLAIVKNLTELHGGAVRAHSAGSGQGSTFTVQLPLGVVPRDPDAPARQRPSDEQGTPDYGLVDLSGIRVLVVDDQGDARDLVGRVLSECKAEVITAADAAEALALVERERPHVLVSDIGMPDVDGYELLKRVRALGVKHGGAVPAIALTAFARSEDRTRALNKGFRVHVSKPVEPAELIATVASVAGRTGG